VAERRLFSQVVEAKIDAILDVIARHRPREPATAS
jgi:hypothetical protein